MRVTVWIRGRQRRSDFSLLRSDSYLLPLPDVFVVLIVTVATSNGVLVGVSDYWVKSTLIEDIAYFIPWVGMVFAALAILVWFIRMFQGMQQLRNNQPHTPSTGPNL